MSDEFTDDFILEDDDERQDPRRQPSRPFLIIAISLLSTLILSTLWVISLVQAPGPELQLANGITPVQVTAAPGATSTRAATATAAASATTPATATSTAVPTATATAPPSPSPTPRPFQVSPYSQPAQATATPRGPVRVVPYDPPPTPATATP